MRMGSVPIPPDRSVVLLGLWYWPALKASQVAGLSSASQRGRIINQNVNELGSSSKDPACLLQLYPARGGLRPPAPEQHFSLSSACLLGMYSDECILYLNFLPFHPTSPPKWPRGVQSRTYRTWWLVHGRQENG